MKPLTFGSLFAGIGGFDLGFERAGMVCKWQVEIDEYCRKVLEKHWPNVPRHDDVRTFPPKGDWTVDLICGGFPCQDISFAGYGAGLAGERSGLWREYLRIIRTLRPKFVVIENVAALVVRGLDTVLFDLAECGFDAEWSIVSACSMGAPHLRQRLFIVAYTNSLNGWPWLRNPHARQDGTVQTIDGKESARTRWQARLANPSELYGGANGIPNGSHRNRSIGNSVCPDVAEWIGRRIVETQGDT